MAAARNLELSIIVPVLDEAAIIVECLTRLQPMRKRGVELIVVDGGSTDATPELARPLADKVIEARPSRALQMNAGADVATGTILLFLHADCALPPDAESLIDEVRNKGQPGWGRFDVAITGKHPMLRVIAWSMNLRSRMSGIATGDQAIFVCRGWFDAVGGYPQIELMEDIVLSGRLRARGLPHCLRAVVRTSGRRWESRGVTRTVLRMWWLRLRFFLGANPADLAKAYDQT